MKKAGFLAILALMFLASPVLARSGCCSHHGGVMANGCGCNDGTPLSSTCAPYYVCTANQPQYVPKVQQETVYPTTSPIPTKVYIRPNSTPTRKPTIKPTATPSSTPSLIPTLKLSDTPSITHTISTKPSIQQEKKITQTQKNLQNETFIGRLMNSALRIAFSQFNILSLL
jgi:hypothetical protein